MASSPQLLYLLDTNVLSNALLKRPDAAVEARIVLNTGRMAVPAPVWQELRYGWLLMPEGQRKDRHGAYLHNVVARLPMLAYDTAAASLHAEQRAASERAGRMRPATDSLIAAIAVAHSLTLVSHNTRDFAGIAGLKVEDWFGATPTY